MSRQYTLPTPMYNNTFWSLDDVDEPNITAKDEWVVSDEHPYKISQLREIQLTEEAKRSMSGMQGMNRMLYYAMSTGNIYYEGTSHNQKSSSKIYREEETAETIQKQKLLKHFKHKLSKTSSKKKEYSDLSKIIDMYQVEIEEYIDTYPERVL